MVRSSSAIALCFVIIFRRVLTNDILGLKMWVPYDNLFNPLSERRPSFDPSATLNANFSKSQFKEDVFAFKNYFAGLTNGTYIEMGALNGQLFSNTWYFNKFLGWRGILVEATPDLFPQIIANRPDDIVVSMAVCAKPQQVHHVKFPHNAFNGILEFMNGTNRNMENVMKLPKTKMPCLPLKSLLRWLSITHINFFSLDVEGGEYSVLQTFEFERVKIDVFVIERQKPDARLEELMSRNGYVFAHQDHKNVWYTHHLFKPSSG